MKNWQFNVLFFVGVGSAVLLLIGPEFGLSFSQNPTALAGVGSILTYILTQRGSFNKKSWHIRRRDDSDDEEKDENDEGEDK